MISGLDHNNLQNLTCWIKYEGAFKRDSILLCNKDVTDLGLLVLAMEINMLELLKMDKFMDLEHIHIKVVNLSKANGIWDY
jgi:hypothetical protein